MHLSELVDIGELRGLCESFTAINGAVTAVIDLEGQVLVATGWQDICTQFHRIHPVTCARCHESDTDLAGRLKQGEAYNVYQCKNGMVDVAVPITIGGEHVANFFTGQFFLEAPDKTFFLRQADEFGFDKPAYLAAMARAPTFSAEQVQSMMAFFSRLAKVMGEMGLARLRLQQVNTKFQASAAIVQSSEDAIIGKSLDGSIESWNAGAEKMFGYTSDEAIGSPVKMLIPSDRMDEENGIVARISQGERVSHFETLRRRKDGQLINVSISISPILNEAGQVIGASKIARNITESKQAAKSLRQRQIMLERTESMARLASFEWDVDSNVVTWSPEMFLLFGRDPASGVPNLQGQAELYTPQSTQLLFDAVRKAVSDAIPYELELMTVQPDGELRPCFVKGFPERGESGRVIRLTGLVQDITQRKREEAKIRLAASVFSHAREGITITTASGEIVDINEAFTRITGYSREDAIGQTPRILKSARQDPAFYEAMWGELTGPGHWSGEIWNRRKCGEVYAALLTISAVRDAQGTTQQYVALFSDITGIKEHQKQLEHIAHFDALTGLPNRVLLADRLQQAMSQAQRRQQQLAVVYLDLDGFKAINDRHGHEAGDQLLITLAHRMKQSLREGDTLARLGGDEFVAVLIDMENMAASLPMFNRLLAAAAQPLQLGEITLKVSASLGVTFYPQTHELDADQLLRQSDQAMYQAKVAGKNRYQLFDAAHDRDLRVRHESLERVRLALDKQEFVLHFQPKVNMRSGQVIGAEALIRWQHPERGLLAPAEFLPVIEDHPLAVAVGEWVIDTTLGQMAHWHAAGLELREVSINAGARQLLQRDFVARLKVILAKHPRVNPAHLQIEVLETSALADMVQASQVIEECARIGVMFALDDFGTGYSSLSYLKRLRVTTLKIDQSFVRDMLEDPDDLAILDGVIGLAAAFKLQVIAEGVETVEHGTALLHLGCEMAQGYGIARPMPGADLPAWATAWQPADAWSRVSYLSS